MMDLREFLKVLEEEHELQKIKVEVDPKHELGAICKIQNERPNSPALLFENVKGHKIPVVGQLLASDRRVALALGLSQENVFDETVQRASNPIAPKLVSKGASQDIVFEGADVDLTKLPLCTNNPRDGGPYITAGHVIIKDPEYGMNLSIYRMMLVSKNEVTLRFTPGHDGYDFMTNAEKRGQKKFEVAVCIGVPPAVYVASQFEPRIGVYELDIAGGLVSEPVEVVKCRTIDLEVPALAEIVLEGELTIPAKSGNEGPFGEFCGYTTAQVPNERIMTVKAVTHRKSPVYHNIWLGKPPHEHLYVDALTYAVAAYQELKPAYPALKKAYAPPWGVSIVLLLQLEKRLMRPGIVDNILAASLYTRSGKWKHVFVLDEDIVLEDPNEVLWALTTRFQPATDMFVIPRGITSSLEPSASVDGLTSKLMLDLTIKKHFRGEVAEPTAVMRESVLKKWKEYGFN
ncbi:MAG TPA: UbiD family decarboxylase [Candidatus Polarisedimenticolaceae bacterium]|nr:UbiD family decarboxylase [Candidatus Polarisedimenticolaceae bacterium]